MTKLKQFYGVAACAGIFIGYVVAASCGGGGDDDDNAAGGDAITRGDDDLAGDTGATPGCQAAPAEAVKCTDNSKCSLYCQICDAETNFCGPCASADQCGAGFNCDGGLCLAAPASETEQDTPPTDTDQNLPPVEQCTPFCGTRQCGDDGCGGSCGECTADPKFPECEAGLCLWNKENCATDADCPDPARARCYTQTGRCYNEQACQFADNCGQMTCNPIGTCTAGTRKQGESCGANIDCEKNMPCPPTRLVCSIQCAADPECPQGQGCVSGYCEMKACHTDQDCAAANPATPYCATFSGKCQATPAGCNPACDTAAGMECDLATGTCKQAAGVCNPPCAQGESCNNGVCTPMPAQCNPPCDSAAGETCNNGVCQPAGSGCNPACQPGETCTNGVCQPSGGGGCNPACSAGFTCQSGSCVPAGGSCNPPCGANEACQSGQCVPSGPGSCNPPCGAGMSCVGGQCQQGGGGGCGQCTDATQCAAGEQCVGALMGVIPGTCQKTCATGADCAGVGTGNCVQGAADPFTGTSPGMVCECPGGGTPLP